MLSFHSYKHLLRIIFYHVSLLNILNRLIQCSVLIFVTFLINTDTRTSSLCKLIFPFLNNFELFSCSHRNINTCVKPSLPVPPFLQHQQAYVAEMCTKKFKWKSRWRDLRDGRKACGTVGFSLRFSWPDSKRAAMRCLMAVWSSPRGHGCWEHGWICPPTPSFPP